MKTLEQARDRRYDSASALARDIRRHKNHEPVHLALAVGQGSPAEALPLHQQVLELKRTHMGEKDRLKLLSMTNLAVVYRKLGRYDEAEEMFEASLEAHKQVYGPTTG